MGQRVHIIRARPGGHLNASSGGGVISRDGQFQSVVVCEGGDFLHQTYITKHRRKK